MGVLGRRAASVGISAFSAEFLNAALLENGLTPMWSARDGESGLRLIEGAEPDLVVAAAIMPGMDGVAFARRVRRLKLSVKPALLLLKPPGLRLPGEDALEGLDVRLLEAPPSAGALAKALAPEPDAALPPEKARRLADLLDALGVPRHPGRECLELAVALVWRDRRMLYDMKGRLYPELFRHTGRSPAQAERAMRHAIGAAWRIGELEQQHSIFGDTIDARRGTPTCGEMIAQLAEELRWEG